MTNFFKIKRKTYFGVIFAQREFFLKTLEYIDHQSRHYSITINMQKSFNQSAQFIKSFLRCTWFKSPMIYEASPVFDKVHPIIIKVTFSFPKFLSACKKSAHFIHSWDTADFRVWDLKGQTHIWPPKIIKVIFGFPEFLSMHQKSIYSIDTYLRYSQF